MTDDDVPEYDNLTQLPVEILFTIFQFLEAQFLSTTVSQVCRRFNELLLDGATWKAWMNIKWTNKYLVPPGPEIDWKEACIQRERQNHLWKNPERTMERTILPIVHIAIVDCFHKLPNQHVVSASRDRSFCVWDINNRANDSIVHHSVDAHDGWIWCITGSSDQMFTGSWDQSVKCWDINNLFRRTQTILYKAAVLCLAYRDNVLYTGTFDGVHSRDLRGPKQTQKIFRYHRKPILGITLVDQNYLVSISEDTTLVARDIRMTKILKTCKFDTYPTSLFAGNGHVWVGDKRGSIHLLDSPGFETVKVWRNVHKKNITALEHSLGGIISVSIDKTVCVLEPTEDVKVITRLETKEELTGFATVGDQLISSMTGPDVSVWSPKE